MSLPKMIALLTIVLFGTIGIAVLFKKGNSEPQATSTEIVMEPIEIELEPEIQLVEESEEEIVVVEEKNLPEADRIEEFFNTGEPKLPIVQTIRYKSRAPWQKGRPAWVADYASHFKTSRHFIARSLNGKPNYDKQDVVDGDRFNVFREEKNFEFYLVIDVLLSKMWFYYHDIDTNERTLVKTYQVGLGRPDTSAISGSLTPLGKYSIGDKIAIYRPKTKGYHQGEKIELVRVFGTRWIPFGEELKDCTAPSKGLGLHGLPLALDASGNYVEDFASLGKQESDGCIRMATKDIEELFSIIITRSTTIELVKGFHRANLPGEEK